MSGCVEEKSAVQQGATAQAGKEEKLEKKEITWKQFTSPQGRFTIYIPEGWKYKSYSEDESNFAFSPGGKNVPEVGITFSFAFNQKDIKQKMSAKEFLETVLVPFMKSKDPSFKAEAISASSDTVAEITASGTYYGEQVNFAFVVFMDYFYDETMPSPTLSTDWSSMGGWYNFCFLANTIASSEDLPRIKPLAAQMTGSFKPNSKWLSEVRESLASGIAARTEMIKGTIARITAMEYNQRMSEMQSSYNIGLGWINTFGGTADARNPSTGEVWHVDYSYRYYYQKGMEIKGMNDPFKEPGWTQLEIIR